MRCNKLKIYICEFVFVLRTEPSEVNLIHLNKREHWVHEQGVKFSRLHKVAEQNLVEIFIQNEEMKLYHRFDKKSLFEYATEILEMSPSIAYNLITVGRKASEVPAFREAIAHSKLSVWKASRIAAHVGEHSELIDFACRHSKREIDMEVAKLNPRVEPKNKIKFVSEDQIEFTVTGNRATLEALERVQSLLAQRDLPATLSDAVEACVHQYIDRKDPVKRADRNVAEFCTDRVGPLTQAERNAAFKLHRGRCTHPDHEGKRCNSDRWVDIHHIIPVSEGGTNAIDNLTVLCSFHHRQIHRSTA